MATWPDNIYQDNQALNTNTIDHGYSDAVTVLGNNGVPEFTYRDLQWTGGDIIRKSDGLSSASFTSNQKLKYYPQLIQLIDIGSKIVIFPV